MGTHPIFESDFDCLTEMLSRSTGIISRSLSVTRCLNTLKKKSAGTSYKNQSSFHEKFLLDYLPDEHFKRFTKNAFQELVHGLKNEDSDISDMFCSRSPELEGKIRREWKWLSQNDKILNEKIFEDCEIVVEKFDRGYFCDKEFKAIITSKNPSHDKFHATFKCDEETEQWLLQDIRHWPIDKFEIKAGEGDGASLSEGLEVIASIAKINATSF